MIEAHCLHCHHDVTKKLETDFLASCASGPPDELQFDCPNCGWSLFFTIQSMYAIADFVVFLVDDTRIVDFEIASIRTEDTNDPKTAAHRPSSTG